MKPRPQIGHFIRFVTCTEVATVRFVVEDVLVCSSSQSAITLVPIAQIINRTSEAGWRADVHYHEEIYDVTSPDGLRTLEIARLGTPTGKRKDGLQVTSIFRQRRGKKSANARMAHKGDKTSEGLAGWDEGPSNADVEMCQFTERNGISRKN